MGLTASTRDEKRMANTISQLLRDLVKSAADEGFVEAHEHCHACRLDRYPSKARPQVDTHVAN
jgi:hypothetical protein